MAHETTGGLSERVTYEEAAEMLHISVRSLRREISKGEIPVIQPASGRARAYIEVSALRDWLDRKGVASQRAAARKRRQASQRQSRPRRRGQNPCDDGPPTKCA